MTTTNSYSVPAAFQHPYPLPEHEGIRPGQIRESSLGTRYEIYAVTSDGYVWCLAPHRGGKQIKRIWCDVVSGWREVTR